MGRGGYVDEEELTTTEAGERAIRIRSACVGVSRLGSHGQEEEAEEVEEWSLRGYSRQLCGHVGNVMQRDDALVRLDRGGLR